MANPYGRLDGKAPRFPFTAPDPHAIMPPIQHSMPPSVVKAERDKRQTKDTP